LLALVAIAAFLWNRDRDTPPPERPTVVVAGLQTLSGDSADAWLGDGLQQMISADLARSTAVEVVAPSRLRAVLARARLGTQRTLADDAARTVADRLGAEWVVSGGISYGGDRLLVLDVNVRDVKSGHRLALFSVTGRDPMAVADQAAARILTQASASLPGPRLAQTETASLAGYEHYVRAEQATAEGRDAEATEELDAAIAADSGFISAIVERMRRARYGDPAMLERLSDAYARAATRATEYDQLDQALFSALHNGEHTRAEALGREMVAHYPHDPRVYATLADVLASHGKWSEADSVLREAIALDSSAAAAGSGPCAPCAGYSGLVSLRVTFGDTHEAEVAARRWVTLQPAVPLAWAELADVLSYEGRYPDAIAAAQRARLLGGVPGEPYYDARLGNLLLRARRYGDVDTLIARWSGDRRQEVRSTAADLDALLQRERGQFLESAHTIARAIRADSGLAALELMEANSLARAGYIDSALALMHHAMLQGEPEVAPVTSLAGDRARKFSWEHALLADLQATTADTSVLRALADSIDRISTRSYYGRDWHLAHHVRGLIAERAGNWADAVREFSEARWGRAGWTRTNVELARADLELGLADSAIAVLRDAYRGPLDAMGRYVPRGELDAWMARAETAAGHADSAAVYEGYVRDARQGGQGGRS
jgi:TolB-like protein